jgi:hypothetical protein
MPTILVIFLLFAKGKKNNYVTRVTVRTLLVVSTEGFHKKVMTPRKKSHKFASFCSLILDSASKSYRKSISF